MKKTVLILLSIMVCAISINAVNAKVKVTSPELANAIRAYKAKNYSQSYLQLNKIIEKDPANTLAYYYLAMTSAQIGKTGEAISNYNKVIELSPNGRVGLYAKKGKQCLESPDKCHEEISEQSELDKFIYGKYGNGFSEEAWKVHEKEKIENMKREMNRHSDIEPRKFQDYKDFSSEVPTNDEIVNALRVLQRAGLNNNYNSDLLFTNNYNNEYEMLNMMLGNKKDGLNINPQLIQSMLSSQMSTNF